MKRKKYISATVSYVTVESGTPILTGSVTKTPLKLGNVTVEPYQSGFEDSAGNDFATISFD